MLYFKSEDHYKEWCKNNDYSAEEEFDLEKIPEKREVFMEFCIYNSKIDRYARVGCTYTYDWGRDNYYVVAEGLKRIEKQVTVVDYVRAI
jgi:hypothetical protein